MGQLVIIFKFTKRYMCIDLRSGQRFVTQQFFNAIQFCSAVEHRRSKSVPQHMRRIFVGAAHTQQRVVHHSIHERWIQRLAIGFHKERFGSTHLPIANFAIAAYPVGQFFAKRHYAILIALAMHLYLLGIEVYIGIGKPYQLGAAYTGLFALLGHAYPVWYKFKGGKGFLVYTSVIWFIDWRAGLVALVVMLILLAVSKYMSLSTVVGLLTCPVTLAFLKAPLPIILICAASVLFIAYRHKENFKRLLSGTESKFELKSGS